MNRSSWRARRPAAFGLLVVLLVGACAGGASPGTASQAPGASTGSGPAELKTSKIGVLAPITGPSAADGQEMLDAVTLAVEGLNASGGAGGYKFEVVSADTQDQRPDAVTSAVQRLLGDNGVHAILTGYASGTNFEIDLMAEAQMPYILGANTAQTRDIIKMDPAKYPTVWSLAPSYDAYEQDLPVVLEEWIKAEKFTPTNRKVYVVTSDNPYSSTISNGLTKSFQAAGWTTVGGDVVPFGQVNDWRAILTKIRAEAPDVIVNTDYLPANGATFMTQFMENPINSLMFIQYGPSVPEFVELTKEQSNGVLYNVLITPVPGITRTDELKKAYSDKIGKEGGVYSVALQEAVYLYADAVEAVGGVEDHLAIGEWIGKAEKDMALGHLKFEQDSHLATQGEDFFPILFYQLRNQGERVLVWPEKYKAGEFELPPWYK
jgi:branched-chain amino acid transport system substrate-binding protein